MATYQEIRRQIVNLTPDEQILLWEELTTIVRDHGSASFADHIKLKPKRSIIELAGLGIETMEETKI